MSKDINTISVQEKREIAKIISDEYETIITNLQNEIKFTEGEILEEAQKMFGIKAIDLQINQLKEQINMLEKKKLELGFSDRSYDNGFRRKYDKGRGDIVDPNTKAGKFYYMKMARHTDINELRKQKNERLKNLWLENERSKIIKIAASIIEDSKKIEGPKKTKKEGRKN